MRRLDRQAARNGALRREDWAAERRRQRREYMADWRASNPEAEARLQGQAEYKAAC